MRRTNAVKAIDAQPYLRGLEGWPFFLMRGLVRNPWHLLGVDPHQPDLEELGLEEGEKGRLIYL